MTKLSDLGPPITGELHGGQPEDEHDNFITCSICRQKIDMRDFRQVTWHAEQVHPPLEMDE